MQALRFAFSFLTILPVGPLGAVSEKTIARSLAFYSLVGFALGGLLFGTAWILHTGPAPELNSAVILAVWVISTRALHLDGLMDSFDGLLSGRDRARKLEIMKDSRVGAMGAIALALQVLVKWSALGVLLESGQYWVLAAAPAVGRSAMLPAMVFYPYAREENGLGRSFSHNAGFGSSLAAGLILAAGIFWLNSGPGLLIMLTSLAASALIMHAMARSLGGHTGDTYGAICEITESLFLLAAVYGPALWAGLQGRFMP